MAKRVGLKLSTKAAKAEKAMIPIQIKVFSRNPMPPSFPGKSKLIEWPFAALATWISEGVRPLLLFQTNHIAFNTKIMPSKLNKRRQIPPIDLTFLAIERARIEPNAMFTSRVRETIV